MALHTQKQRNSYLPDNKQRSTDVAARHKDRHLPLSIRVTFGACELRFVWHAPVHARGFFHLDAFYSVSREDTLSHPQHKLHDKDSESSPETTALTSDLQCRPAGVSSFLHLGPVSTTRHCGVCRGNATMLNKRPEGSNVAISTVNVVSTFMTGTIFGMFPQSYTFLHKSCTYCQRKHKHDFICAEALHRYLGAKFAPTICFPCLSTNYQRVNFL